MVGRDEITLSTLWSDLTLIVESQPRALNQQEFELAQRTAFEFRVGLEAREPTLVRAALQLYRALNFSNAPELHRDDAFFLRDIARELQDALLIGRLRVVQRLIQPLAERQPLEMPSLEKAPPPKESNDTFFEVRLVDETGQSIPGVDVNFVFGSNSSDIATNGAGVALLEGVLVSSASAGIPDTTSLEEILDRRWVKPRPLNTRKEGNSTELVFAGSPIAAVGVKPALPNTIVLKPPLGQLFVELWDRCGRVRHRKLAYTIEGTQLFTGTTDDQGRLQHPGVFPGDYTLKFTLTAFAGKDEQSDSFICPLVVLPAAAAQPITRLLGAVPFAVTARLHLFFNSSKTFLLPTALSSVRKLRALYLRNNPSKLLVVGHADTRGGTDFNDKLSLERARSMIAYLKDDVDTWLENYDSGVDAKKRWGGPEDRMMLMSMPDFVSKPKGEGAVSWFQRTRGLSVDGKAGPETRRRLVTEYMGLDGASLSEAGIEIDATAHGCGEHFPLDDSGEKLDSASEDEKRDPGDRRVELFFFEPQFGIVPAPAGGNSAAGSTEYPEWRKRSIELHDFDASDFDGPKVTFVEMLDALFRTNSAVVLPEGEAVDDDKPKAPAAIHVIATTLRFNQANPGKKMFIGGHADTTGTESSNQPLSEERARCTLALLLGGSERDNFKQLCHARHTVRDYKQILRWVSRTFADLSFNCDPGAIDDDVASGKEPIRSFQRAYNANKATLGATADDLRDDGEMGPLTWGAFFDCYQFSLQRELGEDAAAVQALRDKLVFVDEQRKSLGFSEYFPVEELGVDNFSSQTNRRVELLFFDESEEPDLEHAQAAPETSELYLPGVYVREPVPIRRGDQLRPRTLRIFLLDERYQRMPNTAYQLQAADVKRKAKSDADGLVVERIPPVDTCQLSWSLESLPGPAHPDLPIEERFAEPAPEFRFRTLLKLLPDPPPSADLQKEAQLRLENMGYLERPFTQRYGEFRRDYGRPAQQTMDRAGFDDLVTVHRQGQEAPVVELPDAPFEPQPGEDDGGLVAPLEFELKLADGKPARGAAFSVASSAGVIRTGKLDEAGRASLTDLEPGSYTVSFPDLDTESVSREV